VALISYLRWVVLWNVVLCSSVPLQVLVTTHRPAHAVGRVALPWTGRMTSDRNPSPLATRRPLEIQGAPRTGAGPGHPGHGWPRYLGLGDPCKPGPSHRGIALVASRRHPPERAPCGGTSCATPDVPGPCTSTLR